MALGRRGGSNSQDPYVAGPAAADDSAADIGPSTPTVVDGGFEDPYAPARVNPPPPQPAPEERLEPPGVAPWPEPPLPPAPPQQPVPQSQSQFPPPQQFQPTRPAAYQLDPLMPPPGPSPLPSLEPAATPTGATNRATNGAANGAVGEGGDLEALLIRALQQTRSTHAASEQAARNRDVFDAASDETGRVLAAAAAEIGKLIDDNRAHRDQIVANETRIASILTQTCDRQRTLAEHARSAAA